MSTYQAIDNNDQLKERVRRNKEYIASIDLANGKDSVVYVRDVESGTISSVTDLWGMTPRQLEQKGEQIQQATADILNEDLDTMVRCYACHRHYDCAEYDQCPHCGAE